MNEQLDQSQSYQTNSTGYAKRPMWQWVVIYLLIGGAIYAGIYYFFYSGKGGYAQNVNVNAPVSPQASSAPLGEAQPIPPGTNILITK